MGETIDNEFVYNDSSGWDTVSSLMPDKSTHQLSDNDWSNYNYDNMFKTTETTFSTEQTTMESSDAIESNSTTATINTTEASVVLLEEENVTDSLDNSVSIEVIFP